MLGCQRGAWRLNFVKSFSTKERRKKKVGKKNTNKKGRGKKSDEMTQKKNIKHTYMEGKDKCFVISTFNASHPKVC